MAKKKGSTARRGSKIAREKLTFETVADLDNGYPRKEFARLAKMVVDDMLARPEIKKSRKLHITLELSPTVDKDTKKCGHIMVVATLNHAVPPSVSELTRAVPDKSGQMEFKPESPEDPDQMGLGDVDGGGEDK